METPSHLSPQGGSNLRPAPLELSPAVVENLLDSMSKAAAVVSEAAQELVKVMAAASAELAPYLAQRIAHVPVVSTKLVDVPRRSEDPRLAKANDDQPASRSKRRPAMPVKAAPADVTKPAPLSPRPAKIALPAPAREPQPGAMAPVGQRPSLPVNPAIKFNADLARPIAFLKARCILVSPVNRQAEVMTYRVSGRQHARLGAEVIEMAINQGMSPNAEGGL